jgi:hypothetical protein
MHAKISLFPLNGRHCLLQLNGFFPFELHQRAERSKCVISTSYTLEPISAFHYMCIPITMLHYMLSSRRSLRLCSSDHGNNIIWDCVVPGLPCWRCRPGELVAAVRVRLECQLHIEKSFNSSLCSSSWIFYLD